MKEDQIIKWLLNNRNIDGLAIKYYVDLLLDFQKELNKPQPEG